MNSCGLMVELRHDSLYTGISTATHVSNAESRGVLVALHMHTAWYLETNPKGSRIRFISSRRARTSPLLIRHPSPLQDLLAVCNICPNCLLVGFEDVPHILHLIPERLVLLLQRFHELLELRVCFRSLSCLSPAQT